MTATGTFTGFVHDKSNHPIKRAKIKLTAVPAQIDDPVAKKTYSTCPDVMTDDAGMLCRRIGQDEPDDDPGLELIIGVQYTISSVRAGVLAKKSFTLTTPGQVLDYSDIAAEPILLEPTWAETLAGLLTRLEAVEQNGPGGGGTSYDDTALRADVATRDASVLTQAKAYADALGVNLSALITLAEESTDIATLAASVQALADRVPDVTQAELDAEATARSQGDTSTLAAAASDATSKANTAQAAAVQRANHTGTQSLDTTTDSATRLALTAAERTKVAGVATGATANSTDAQLRDRSTHTGTQAASTITGLAAVATSGSKADVGLGNVPNLSASGLAGDAAFTGTYAKTLTRTSKTAAYTAALWDLVAADTTGGTFAVTLPAASAGKGRVAIKWVAGTAAPTIAFTGTDRLNTATGPTSGTFTVANQGFVLESDGVGIWTVTADDAPISQLDARFATATAVAGKGDAVGPWRDVVRAAQFGQPHTAAIASDSTGDDLLTGSLSQEWPTLMLRLLAAQYPANKYVINEFSDSTQTYATDTVISAGNAPTGGTIAHDTFSASGNAVGAATDDVGTWGGSGTVTKASGIATPAANSSLSVLTPSQDGTTVLGKLKVTTAGFTGGSQAYRAFVACSNSAGTGFGYSLILTITTANQTFLTIRRIASGGTTDLYPTTALNMGLNSVTAADATVQFALSGTSLTATITVGATITTQTVTVDPADLSAMGFQAGFAVGATAGAVALDELSVTTPVIPTPTIRIYNGSVAGKDPSYVPTRTAALFPVPMDSVVLSYGHNWIYDTATYITSMSAALAAVKSAQPNARISIASQNPEFPPYDATKVANHKARQSKLPFFARDNGCQYIPVFEAFEASGADNGLSLVQSDGVHPTNPPGTAVTDGYGSTLWARTVTGIAAPATSGGLTQTAADARYPLLTAGNPGTACPLKAGNWYPIGPVMQHLNAIPPEGNEQAVPFIAGRTTTVTSIAIQVGTAGSTGAVIRMGVRADNGSEKPGALIVDAGTVDGTTIGVKTVTVSVPVVAGTRYWVTHTVQGAATTRPTLVCLYNLSAPMFGAANATDSLANTNYGWRVSGVAGALPAGMTPDNMLGVGAKTVITAAS